MIMMMFYVACGLSLLCVAIVYDMKAQHNKLTILLLCSMHLLEDSDDDDDDVLNKTYSVFRSQLNAFLAINLNSGIFLQFNCIKHQHVQGIIDRSTSSLSQRGLCFDKNTYILTALGLKPYMVMLPFIMHLRHMPRSNHTTIVVG